MTHNAVLAYNLIVLASYAVDDLLERAVRPRVVVAAGCIAASVIAYFAVKSRSLVSALVGAPHHATWAAVSTAWAVAGINCIRPIAPLGETAFESKLDSTATMLLRKASGT